jgi:antitoxin VapB
MALNIKDPEVHDLARRLAERRGTTLTDAVRRALAEALARTRQGGEPTHERLRAIARHCASLPLLDPRRPEEIVGYDAQGLPR